MKRGAPFDEWYIPVPECGCWLWLGHMTSKGGYGRRVIGKRRIVAHRFVYESLVGPVPDGMQLNHKCDTPSCVNPQHMEIGTQKQNVAQCYRNGRARKKRKLTEDQAIRIKFGGERAKDLSAELGVSCTTIHYIRSGKDWPHLWNRHV